MSVSTNAVLFYGFQFEPGDEPWAGEEEFCGEDWIAQKLGLIRPSGSHRERPKEIEEYWKIKAAALAEFGVEIDSHQHCDWPIYYVAVVILTARRGYPVKIEEHNIDQLKEESAEKLLRRFCDLAGVAYEDQNVGWWLASYSEH